LATAETLSPQASLGFRSGVIRELVRLLEVGTSEVAGVAGRVSKLGIPVAEVGRAGILGIIPQTEQTPETQPEI